MGVFGMWAIIDADIISVGNFIAMIKILKMVGRCYGNLYTLLLQMQEAITPLNQIAVFMNLPVDVHEGMRLNRKRRERGEIARKQSRDAKAELYAVDGMQI